MSAIWYKLYTGAEGSNLEVPFQGANLPVAKPWNAETANKSNHTQNAQPTSSNAPYNCLKRAADGLVETHIEDHAGPDRFRGEARSRIDIHAVIHNAMELRKFHNVPRIFVDICI